ncbi:MAG: hypothetical protein IJ112_06110 [Oscillospiraceae bacterium]|nr:hypothetical protein [Oscillospiraceae bacterium]
MTKAIWFFVGFGVGGIFMMIVMCFLQINRIHAYENVLEAVRGGVDPDEAMRSMNLLQGEEGERWEST